MGSDYLHKVKVSWRKNSPHKQETTSHLKNAFRVPMTDHILPVGQVKIPNDNKEWLHRFWMEEWVTVREIKVLVGRRAGRCGVDKQVIVNLPIYKFGMCKYVYYSEWSRCVL